MQFFGKIELMPMQSGTSTNGNEWKRYPFYVREPNGSQCMYLTLTEPKYLRLKEQGFANGAVGTVKMYADTREYNGRIYNEFNVNGFEPVTSEPINNTTKETEPFGLADVEQAF